MRDVEWKIHRLNDVTGGSVNGPLVTIGHDFVNLVRPWIIHEISGLIVFEHFLIFLIQPPFDTLFVVVDGLTPNLFSMGLEILEIDLFEYLEDPKSTLWTIIHELIVIGGTHKTCPALSFDWQLPITGTIQILTRGDELFGDIGALSLEILEFGQFPNPHPRLMDLLQCVFFANRKIGA